MANQALVNAQVLQEWLHANLELQTVQQKLNDEGHSEDFIAQTIAAYRKMRIAKRQGTGFVLLAIGAFLGFISCVLSLINPFPELYNLILFGLTSFSILIIVGGLYYLFE